MSQNVRIYGVTAKGKVLDQMQTIHDLCLDNNIEIPNAVLDYFADQQNIDEKLELDVPLAVDSGDYVYTVDLKKTPKDVVSLQVRVRRSGS